MKRKRDGSRSINKLELKLIARKTGTEQKWQVISVNGTEIEIKQRTEKTLVLVETACITLPANHVQLFTVAASFKSSHRHAVLHARLQAPLTLAMQGE